MSDVSRGCTSVTSVPKDVLTRLIAAARVSGPVTWTDAETDAEHEVAALWGGRTPAERRLPVEVTTEVLLQLAAAADTAISARSASDAGWARQVGLDLAGIRELIGSASGRPGRPADS